MHPDFVGGGTDTAVDDGGLCLCWLNDSYCVPSFLAVGRNPWYDVGGLVQADRKPAPGCVMSFATESWLDVPIYFYRERTMVFTASKSSPH